MQISDAHRFLFIHVQKTGGTTMDEFLGAHVADLRSVEGVTGRHEPLRKILRIEPGLRSYWTFGFVRNPWARMVSWWSMMERTVAQIEVGHERAVSVMENNRFWQAIVQYPDFETFVARGPEEFQRLRRPQIDYLTTSTRRADLIGRTETFAADTRAIAARLGLPVPTEVPHENPSVHTHYRDYYTPTSRERVAEIFRADVDAFGYEF